MLLAELVSVLAPLQLSGSLQKQITGIVYDSRLVEPGNLFIAVPGFVHDGHDFIAEAAVRGAVAAIISREVLVPEQLTSISVTDSRRAMGVVADLYFGHPSRKLRVIGVTGTNGKTTTTFLIDNLLRMAGHQAGIVGTVHVRAGELRLEAVRTTPEALDLQRWLASMVEADVSHAILEVSSHALALDRVVGCEFDIAVFTNLTQDHLDWHGDMQNYLAAKARLFSGLSSGSKRNKLAIINLDDPVAPLLVRESKVPVITYGIKQAADIRAAEISLTPRGSRFKILQAGKLRGVTSVPTPGYFSVYNALAAIAVASFEGVTWASICDILPESAPVPGRFEPVRAGQPFDIIIDYAHTPDGLENILRTTRDFTSGRVIVVFGCGGDRDRSKRPLMGEVASKLADTVIITTDNPRSEDPRQIVGDILQGIMKSCEVIVDLDRASAIRRAVALAAPGDAVLIAGKGHETYQVFADSIIHFDDKEVAQQAVEVIRNEGMDSRRNSSFDRWGNS